MTSSRWYVVILCQRAEIEIKRLSPGLWWCICIYMMVYLLYMYIYVKFFRFALIKRVWIWRQNRISSSILQSHHSSAIPSALYIYTCSRKKQISSWIYMLFGLFVAGGIFLWWGIVWIGSRCIIIHGTRLVCFVCLFVCLFLVSYVCLFILFVCLFVFSFVCLFVVGKYSDYCSRCIIIHGTSFVSCFVYFVC